MGAYRCKQCNGKLNLNMVPGYGICMYCETAHPLQPFGSFAAAEGLGAHKQAENYLKRAFLFLEEQAWEQADAYCEKALDIDPENPMAYLGKLLAEFELSEAEALANCERNWDRSWNYKNCVRFADPYLRQRLQMYCGGHRKPEAYHGRLRRIHVKAEECSNAPLIHQTREEDSEGWRCIKERMLNVFSVLSVLFVICTLFCILQQW